MPLLPLHRKSVRTGFRVLFRQNGTGPGGRCWENGTKYVFLHARNEGEPVKGIWLCIFGLLLAGGNLSGQVLLFPGADSTAIVRDSLVQGAKTRTDLPPLENGTPERRDSLPVLFPGIRAVPEPEPATTPATAPAAAALPEPASTAAELLEEGRRLHRSYCFEEAIERYTEAYAAADRDEVLPALEEGMRLAQNGLNMTDFCCEPVVVARQRFSRKDFFLFYPLRNQSWRTAPNPLDPSDEGFPTYAPKGGRAVYFSAPDETGARNLYLSQDQDSLWSAPELLGEKLVTLGNEIFPMLSPDGKTLYFASDGLYGMGGYDLYSSAWDETTGSWGEPVNLGFPYSSPADDLLLVHSDDGKYTLFASNRDCSRDSVYLYVLEYKEQPERKAVRNVDQLKRIASLLPLDDPARIDNGSAVSGGVPDNDDTRLYMLKMDEARALRDTIYAYERALDEMRLLLSQGGDGLVALTASIQEKEEALKPLRARLELTSREVRLIEQAFLRSGVVSSSGRADREVVGASLSYTFTKNSMGARLRMKVAGPPDTGESFRVAPVGRFAPAGSLPAGLIYQIQLFTATRHAAPDDLKGLSPVYERLTSTLKYVYSVGVFTMYSEALRQLNKVRSLGFPEAQVTAFLDGRPLPVDEARARSGR